LGLLLGYLATSNAKFDVRFLLGDPDFLYKGDEISAIISLLSRLVIEIPIGLLGVGVRIWGYLATSGAKSDVGFLLSGFDFLYMGDEIPRLSRLIFEMWRGTDTRRPM